MSCRVLLVEHQNSLLQEVSHWLDEIGECEVESTITLESAIHLVGESDQRYQLVIIDVSTLPLIPQALELLQWVKRYSPTTGVLLMGESPKVEQAVQAIKLGADDFLEKPLNQDTFRLAVQRILDRKQVYGEGSQVSLFLNLLNTCQIISSTLERSHVFQNILSYLKRELKAPHGTVFAWDDGKLLKLAEPSQSKENEAMDDLIYMAAAGSEFGKKMKKNQLQFWFEPKTPTRPSLFFFKFRCGTDQDFIAALLFPEKPESQESFEDRIRILKNQVDLTGKNIEQFQGIERLAYQDESSGLLNLRALQIHLEKRVNLARSEARGFAVLFIDIDRFKSINDSLGHETGTRILHELGSHLKKYVRGTDLVYRYGGDEFVAILFPCDRETALNVAERIRSGIEAQTFFGGSEDAARLTVSIGVALFPEHGQHAKALLKAADQAMYQAKKSSRNQVCIAPEASS